MEPYYEQSGITIYHGDCREVLPDISNIGLLLTDPPYSDYHTKTYEQTPLSVIEDFKCRKLVFWSAKAPFPLCGHWTVHIWDKRTGCGSQYERIFDMGGDANWRVFSYYLINSKVAANYTGDLFTGHPSQKPVRLISKLLGLSRDGIVLDPFMGSGTTLVAAKLMERHAIGIEIEEKYCEIAAKRLAQEVLAFG